MDIFQMEIDLSRHALDRANERDVDISLIKNCVRCGKMEVIGKDYLRFTKKFKKRTIICIAQIKKEHITIITVEEK